MLAAILASLPAGPPARASLWLAGLDVLKQPGMTGNGYGVELSTIEVDEQGPGGVSGLSFSIDDPTGTVALPRDGDEVRFQDQVADLPYFGGYVSSWAIRPGFGGQGRTIRVECVGYEILLDWAILPADLPIASGTLLNAAIQSCAASATGAQGLRAFSTDTSQSSQATPIASFFVGGNYQVIQYAITITAGSSLRQALEQCGQAASRAGSPKSGLLPSNIQFTVDPYRGLRAMEDSASSAWATDYAGLTVTDTGASTRNADSLNHETDVSTAVRGVYVKGANAAGSGFLMDGTGLPGRIAFIDDSTIDTAAKLADLQTTYLSGTVITQRGDFRLEDWQPVAGVRPGSLVTLTDAAVGASGPYRIMQITKRFTGARESWHLNYGRLRPSGAALVRSLTRNIRS
jgi:hypothetical protein